MNKDTAVSTVDQEIAKQLSPFFDPHELAALTIEEQRQLAAITDDTLPALPAFDGDGRVRRAREARMLAYLRDRFGSERASFAATSESSTRSLAIEPQPRARELTIAAEMESAEYLTMILYRHALLSTERRARRIARALIGIVREWVIASVGHFGRFS